MLLVSLLAKNLLTLSCQVRQAGGKRWGMDSQASHTEIREQLSLNENNSCSQHFYFSVTPALQAVLPCSVRWAGLGCRWGLPGFTPTLTACFWEKWTAFCSGVHTGNPWMVTFGNGLREGCSLQVSEHTALAGRQHVPGEKCRRSKSLQSRVRQHITRSLESTGKLQSSSETNNEKWGIWRKWIKNWGHAQGQKRVHDNWPCFLPSVEHVSLIALFLFQTHLSRWKQPSESSCHPASPARLCRDWVGKLGKTGHREPGEGHSPLCSHPASSSCWVQGSTEKSEPLGWFTMWQV